MQNLFVKSKRIIFPLLFFFIAFFVFQKNAFDTVNKDFFDGFQKDSEALVVGAIVADELRLDKKKWNLGFVAKNGPFLYPQNIMDSYEIFLNKEGSANAVFSPYRSQVGAQGLFYSKIQRAFSFESISKIQYIPSAILAFLIVAFYYLNRQVYGVRYAWIFSISLVFSPWVVAFARNLYWSEFLWLLPCFFATLAYTTESIKVRCLSYLLVFLTFFAKSLSGYEYITSITLLAISPFVVGPFFSGDAKPKWKSAVLVFALCVLGFFAAILIHANMRGDTIGDGLAAIYKEDVKRRTYSDPSNFDPGLKDSLTANPVKVVGTYIISWHTPLVPGVPGGFFKLLIAFAGIGLLVKKLTAHKTFARDLVFVSYMSLIPLSWYVLAKGHSYIHAHMNYVLWYLGFFPALIYVCINSAVVLSKILPQYIQKLDVQRF